MTSTLEVAREATVLSAAVAEAPATKRIGVLDVARGIAILGTLATNIWIFTDPAGIIGYSSGRCPCSPTASRRQCRQLPGSSPTASSSGC